MASMCVFASIRPFRRAIWSSFGDNSLAGGPADADPESEVAAFANREQGRDGTTA